MTIEKRIEKLEEKQEPKVLINIPIHKWIESDRRELEEKTGIKYLLGNEKSE